MCAYFYTAHFVTIYLHFVEYQTINKNVFNKLYFIMTIYKCTICAMYNTHFILSNATHQRLGTNALADLPNTDIFVPAVRM